MKLHIVLLAVLCILFVEGAAGTKNKKAFRIKYSGIGCFKSSKLLGEPMQGLKFLRLDNCAIQAGKKGYSTFGVRGYFSCYSNVNASANFDIFGRSSACENGRGASDSTSVYVYQLDVNYQKLGCWKDNHTKRALPRFFGAFKKNNVNRTCADNTRASGWTIFGIQNGNECWSGESGESSYKVHGSGSDCVSDGTGGVLQNEVYRLPAQKCLKCNGTENCTTEKCSNGDPYCFRLHADRETKDTAFGRVIHAGCISDCTEKSKKRVCSGKKNCDSRRDVSCCAYGENCNDPYNSDSLPKCYACWSSQSVEDCDHNRYETPCSEVEDGKSACFTAHSNGIYWKGCAKEYHKCVNDGSHFCKGKTKCSIKCCVGQHCNASIKTGVSAFLIKSCVFMVFVILYPIA